MNSQYGFVKSSGLSAFASTFWFGVPSAAMSCSRAAVRKDSCDWRIRRKSGVWRVMVIGDAEVLSVANLGGGVKVRRREIKKQRWERRGRWKWKVMAPSSVTD